MSTAALAEKTSPNKEISELDVRSRIKKYLRASPGSRRVYRAPVDSSWFVIVDGEEKKKYDRIGKGSLVISPDGSRVAYEAETGKKQFVVFDGKEGKHYDRIGVGGFGFSPDGSRVVYGAETGKKQFVVVDGKEGKHYNGIVTLEGGKVVSGSFDSLYCFCIEDSGIYLVEVRASPIVQDSADRHLSSPAP